MCIYLYNGQSLSFTRTHKKIWIKTLFLNRNDIYLVTVVTALLASAPGLSDVEADLVLLVAPQVRVRHEEQGVVVLTRTGSHKVQHELGFLLQCQPFDRQQLVRLGVTWSRKKNQ